MSAADVHEWFRRRLIAFHLGALAPAELVAFRQHLAECEECWQRLVASIESARGPGAPGGHLPTSVIARWDRISREVRGLERRLLRAHLQDCPDCREDLALLGFAPVLAPAPELEGDAPPATADAPRPVAVARRRQIPRLLAGWAALATVAVALILLVPRARPPHPDQVRVAPTVLLTRLRAEGVETRQLSAATRAIILGFPEIEAFPAAVPISLTVADPAGAALVARTFTAGELRPPNGLIVPAPPGGFAPGVYRVTVTGSEEADQPPRSIDYSLELQRAPQDQ